MTDRGVELAPTTRCCALDRLRAPQPVTASDLTILRRIDELHLDYPFVGNRVMRSMLVTEGVMIGWTQMRTLMRRMGIEALYRRPRTSKPGARTQDLSVSAA